MIVYDGKKGETMNTINVYHDGDSSVGIAGDEATIKMDCSYMDKEQREWVIEGIEMLFSGIWDFSAKA